jgi:hypothetical protein
VTAVAPRRLDRRAVAVGAAATLVVAALPIAAVRLAVGDEATGAERNLWVVAVLALFAGFAVGGHLASKRQPRAPYVHAAAGAATAFAVFAVFTLGRRLLSEEGPSPALLITMVLLLQITMSVAMVSAYLTSRRSR